jgi:hypothetical protein
LKSPNLCPAVDGKEDFMAIAERLICSLALAASVLLAQAPAPNASPSSLVRLSVAAVDASGEPVTDLKIDDLQISDQGKPQRVVFFRANMSAPQTAALGPHEYSNRSGQALPHSTVILFDLLNENQPDRLDAWHKLGRSLQQLESGDSLYLYLLTLEGGLSPIHPIGSKSGDDQTWTQQVEKSLDKAMKAASHARPQEMSDMELVVKKLTLRWKRSPTNSPRCQGAGISFGSPVECQTFGIPRRRATAIGWIARCTCRI